MSAKITHSCHSSHVVVCKQRITVEISCHANQWSDCKQLNSMLAEILAVMQRIYSDSSRVEPVTNDESKR